MDRKIAECDLAALLRFTSEIDNQNENAFSAIESELESARKQYNKVVAQNKSLQGELKIAKFKLKLIKDLIEQSEAAAEEGTKLVQSITYTLALEL
jgi:hypothetical protein